MERKKAYVIRLMDDVVRECIAVEWNETVYESVGLSTPVYDVELSPSEKERYAILKLSPYDTEIKDIGWRFKYVVGVICDET